MKRDPRGLMKAIEEMQTATELLTREFDFELIRGYLRQANAGLDTLDDNPDAVDLDDPDILFVLYQTLHRIAWYFEFCAEGTRKEGDAKMRSILRGYERMIKVIRRKRQQQETNPKLGV